MWMKRNTMATIDTERCSSLSSKRRRCAADAVGDQRAERDDQGEQDERDDSRRAGVYQK